MRALVLTASVLAAVALPTSASGAVTAGGTGWVWANPLPQGGDLDAIAFSGGRGIAVGADGVILRTEDAGASWRLRRGTVFVAQWRGAAGVQADGTPPLAVKVRRRQR